MVILFDYSNLLIRGLGVTLWISWVALILSAVVGAFVGLGRTSKYWPLRILAGIYAEYFRSVPILVALFFVYYGITLLTGLNLSPFTAATIALALEGSAMMSEVVRGGLQSIGKGQREAALSSGMKKWQVELFIVWPQAIRVMIPPAVGVYVSTLKASSLTSIIGYVELTKTGLLIRESLRGHSGSLMILIVVATIYVIINFLISKFGLILEEKNRFVH